MSLPTNPPPSPLEIPGVIIRKDRVELCPVCNKIYGMPWVRNPKSFDDWIEQQIGHYTRGYDLHNYKRPSPEALREFKDGGPDATLALEHD